MKQAIISLIRAVVRTGRESASHKAVALPELSSVELRQVAGGALEAFGPKGTW